MTFRPNTRRVYASWREAMCAARTWGSQTGRKHRVQRYRDWWVVRRTAKRTGPFPPPVGHCIGEVRLVIDMGQPSRVPVLGES